jgi:hypothetical protein
LRPRPAIIALVIVLLGSSTGLVEALEAAACLYDGRAFSDGARICVQKGVMMTCGLETGHPQWTLVDDKDLSSRCLAPTDGDIRAAHARFHHHQLLQPAAVTSAKCFYFSGKQYCE